MMSQRIFFICNPTSRQLQLAFTLISCETAIDGKQYLFSRSQYEARTLRLVFEANYPKVMEVHNPRVPGGPIVKHIFATGDFGELMAGTQEILPSNRN